MSIDPPGNEPSTSESPPPQSRPAAQTSPPQIIIQQQKTALGRYGKLLLILLVLAVIGLAGMQAQYENYFSPPNKPQERFHSLNKKAEKKIAIITVAGAILEGNDFVKQQIDSVTKDKDVVAVVMRIDSPGGTVTGSDYLYHHFRKLSQDEDRKLPLIVSMGSICASGGYYIAMAVGEHENTIFAEPTTWTGSIGVVIPHYDFSGLLASYNIKDDSIASHEKKLMGSPTRELTAEQRAEERKLLQNLVNISFERFKEIVLAGRPELAADLDTFEKATTGEIFTAQQALELGLVDKIGFIEDAIERAAELAEYDVKNVRCIKYKEPNVTLTDLLSAKPQPPSLLGGDLRSLLDLTAPRAYYLCTWLPAILSNTNP